MATMQQTKTALERVTDRVANDPDRGKTVYRNRATVEDGTRCQVRDGDMVMTFDIPPVMGGDGAGPTPGTALRAALAGCLAIGVKMWAARKNVRIDHIEVNLEADSDARGQFALDEKVAPGYGALRAKIDVTSSEADEVIRDVVDQSLKYSPLLDVVANAQNITSCVTVHDNSAEQMFLMASNG